MSLLDLTIRLTYLLLALVLFLSCSLVVWRVRADWVQVRIQAIRGRLQQETRDYLDGKIDVTEAKAHLRSHPEVLTGALIGIAADASKGDLRKLELLFEETGLLDLKLKQLRDHQWLVRSKAANALGFMGSQKAVPMLLRALRDETLDVRLSAAWSLARLKTREAVVPILEHVLLPGTWPFQRVVEVLAQMESLVIPPLMDTLRDSSEPSQVHAVAIRVLGNLKAKESASAIEGYLRDADLEVRIQSAKVLGDLSQLRSVQALVGALEDPSWQVRAAVTQSLGKLGDPFAVPFVAKGLSDASWWVRLNSAEALFRMGEEGKNVLQWSAGAHQDRFARDISKQVLREHEA